ncbi:MAG: hypothetical protein OXE53_13460 [Deltaproteobacteria bacterium]|nr:hypothetical protein [Deltaproteobacteria bacterium]
MEKTLATEVPCWDGLKGRVWHATTGEGALGILREGEIRTSTGRHNAYTYHEHMVSLFDFGPTAHYDAGPPSNVENMMPWFTGGIHRGPSGEPPTMTVWLEADVAKMRTEFCDAAALATRARGKKYTTPYASRPILPKLIFGLEAAYAGPLPVTMLSSAVLLEVHDPFAVIARFDCVETLARRLTAQNATSLT